MLLHFRCFFLIKRNCVLAFIRERVHHLFEFFFCNLAFSNEAVTDPNIHQLLFKCES